MRLYALPYYATKTTLEKKPEMLAGLRARRLARLGICARRIPRRRSTCWSRSIPTSIATTRSTAARCCSPSPSTPTRKANGWGAFDPAIWQEQIALYDDLKQFSAGAPKLEDVITTKILEATKGARAKVG